MHHHEQHQHSHGHSSSVSTLIVSILLLFVFAVIEALGGWWGNSLALISDAGHMASDAIALIIAAIAAWISSKPASQQHSYGFERAEILAAWLSSLLLLVISVAIIVEAITRIHHPPANIHGSLVMIIATIGIAINLLIAWLLSRGEKNLNMRAALLHVISDLLASFAALLSGAVIYYSGWMLVDPILSILISVMVMISSIRILRESILILMEGVPRHINYQAVKQSILAINGIEDIHDLHIWALSSGRAALSAHINIHDLSAWQTVLTELKNMLDHTYHINHVTLQPEPKIFNCEPCQ